MDRARPLEAGQLVEGGDATFRLDSNRRMVGIELTAAIVKEVRLSPEVLTPGKSSAAAW